jgi:hypothetical protein
MRGTMVLAFAFALALPSAASADKWGNPNKGKGNDKVWQGGPHGPGGPPGHVRRFGSHDHSTIHAFYGQMMGRGWCPPGLAKKHNGCLPPGHAKRWIVGQPLAVGVVWYAVPHDLVVRLAPPPVGFRYVYLDGAVLLFNPTTRFVADAVSINVGINIR